MTERVITQFPHEHADVKQTPAQVASTLFIAASGKFPASYHAQGSEIALRCKRNRIDPTELLTALLFDQRQIVTLVDVANNIHASHGMGEFVNEEKLKRTLMYDFNMASYLMDWDEPTLIEFQLKYPEFHNGKTGIDEAEWNYGEYLDALSRRKM